jgi:hypothetical protein
LPLKILVGSCSLFSEHILEILTVIISDVALEIIFNLKQLKKLTKWFNLFNFNAMKKIFLSVAVHLTVSALLKSGEHHLLLTGVWEK